MVSNDLANCFLSIGEYEKALTLQQKVLKIVKNIVNEDPLDIAPLLFYTGLSIDKYSPCFVVQVQYKEYPH